MGPEYLSLIITGVASFAAGGGWVANKILGRFNERVRQLNASIDMQDSKINSLENQVNRLPLEYVLKVDFIREIQEMHDNFKQINGKLDKLMEKILSR